MAARTERCDVLAVKMEEGPRAQAGGGLRSRERRGDEVSPRALGGATAPLMPRLKPTEAVSDFSSTDVRHKRHVLSGHTVHGNSLQQQQETNKGHFRPTAADGKSCNGG